VAGLTRDENAFGDGRWKPSPERGVPQAMMQLKSHSEGENLWCENSTGIEAPMWIRLYI